MTVKGGTNQACAACKYQRRKCSPDCALAPYFPPDQPRMFQNAHKLFGVSNILKVLKGLPPHQRKEAMRSIIMHANIRDKHPVYGCWGIVRDLEYQCQQLCMELNAVQAQLAICRQQYNHQFSDSSPNNSPSSKLQLGQASPHHNNNSAALPLFQHCAPQQQQSFNGTPTGNGISVFAPNQAAGLSYGNNVYGYNNAADYVETKDANDNSMWIQQQEQAYIHQNSNMIHNNYSAPFQSQFLAAEELPIKQQTVDDDPQDYDEIPAFFDIIDDRQSYIDSKEAYESSSDSSLKDTTTRSSNIEQVSDNELKSAAACFSLTSVN